MTYTIRRRTMLAFVAVLAVVALAASDCSCDDPVEVPGGDWRFVAVTR